MLSDTIDVADAFPLASVKVTVDLSHRRVGALVLSITAKPPTAAGREAASRQIVLKERGLGQLGDNMYMTSFSDASNTSFPISAAAAPFRGNYIPTQRLSFFTDGANASTLYAGQGGSQGEWELIIDDVAPNSTYRPIALNGWMLELCPLDLSQQYEHTAALDHIMPASPMPEDIAAGSASPIQVAAAPVDLAAGTPPPPQTVTTFQGPMQSYPTQQVAAQQQPGGIPNMFGWKFIMKPGGVPVVEPGAAGQPGAAGPIVPPTDPLYAGKPQTNALANGIGNFQSAFNSFMQGRYGTGCTDPKCTNIKVRFWKAVLGLAYLKARLSGNVNATEVLDKLAHKFPFADPALNSLANATAEWDARRAELVNSIKTWYDNLHSHLSGNMNGLDTLLSGMTHPGGGQVLKSLGIDPTTATNALGPMLGLENPQDAQALMDGLNQAGFQDLMKEFLTPGTSALQR
jgi:subtilisin-like proprotein convertase family protein